IKIRIEKSYDGKHHGTGEQYADTDERSETGVRQARVEQIGTREARNRGSYGVKRHPKWPFRVRFIAATHKQRDADHQKKEPEDRGCVIDDRTDALAGPDAQPDKCQGDEALHDKSVHGRVGPFIPPAKDTEGGEIEAEGIVGASSREYRGV